MTLSTIIAGCDLSVPSDHALDRACALAIQHEAKLVLVHAQANDDMTPDAGDNAMLQILGEVSGAVRTEEAIRLADKLEINLLEAAEVKLSENAQKYPVEKARGVATKYTKL